MSQLLTERYDDRIARRCATACATVRHRWPLTRALPSSASPSRISARKMLSRACCSGVAIAPVWCKPSRPWLDVEIVVQALAAVRLDEGLVLLQRNAAGEQPASLQVVRREATPTPLVLQLRATQGTPRLSADRRLPDAVARNCGAVGSGATMVSHSQRSAATLPERPPTTPAAAPCPGVSCPHWL